MKKFYLTVILSIPAFLFGQVVNHFEYQDSKWNVAWSYPKGNQQNPNFIETITTVYGFQGDTIIDGKSWNKIFTTTDSLFTNNLEYRGLVQSENNYVFYLDTAYNLDTLYNFNLEVGDSVFYKFDLVDTERQAWIKVYKIDSIEINNQFYKRMYFTEPEIPTAFEMMHECWIEGIGSIRGVLFPNRPHMVHGEFPTDLFTTCTFSNNQARYKNPTVTHCYINHRLDLDEKNLSKFSVYPNPFQAKISISGLENENYEVTIFDNVGKTILAQNLTSNEIDLSALKAGIYFMTIQTQGKNYAETLKIVKY